MDSTHDDERRASRSGFATGQLSTPTDFNTIGADEVRATFEGDAELAQWVSASQLVVYHDEWNNHRTLEARAYGIGRGQRHVLIGFQVDTDRGVAPEQLWKSIDDLQRVYSTGDAHSASDRIIPSNHTGQIMKIIALAPRTGWEQAPHVADED